MNRTWLRAIRTAIALLLAIPVALVLGITFAGCSDKVVLVCPDLTRFIPLALGFFVVLFLLFYFLAHKIGSRKLLGCFFGVVIIFGLAMFLLIQPYTVEGGSVGKYRKGQEVLSIARFLLPFRPIQKGDVVIYARSDINSIGVAYIIGVPGDKLLPNTQYLSNETVEGKVVPYGFFAVTFGSKERVWAIPENQITALVWMGLND